MRISLAPVPVAAIWGQVNWGSFVWGGSGGSAAEWQYLLQDGLGSVRAVADDSAALTQTLDFSPYGVPQGSYGTGFGFTGEYTDANDLLYLRARYYAPEMSVFTALDPWEGKTCTPMSLNGYSWVEGNPITNIDPSGKCLQNSECEKLKSAGLDRDILVALGCLPPLPPLPRISLTGRLGSPANDIIPNVESCAGLDVASQEACSTVQTIQSMWPTNAIPSGPTFGELVALVISVEWYSNRHETGDSGSTCNIGLGDVMELVMAHQFWYWRSQSDSHLENFIRFLSYFEPIREQEIGNRGRGTLFTEVNTGGVLDLIEKAGPYSESSFRSYLVNIFDEHNAFAEFTRNNPGQAVSNCPYGFANFTGDNSQSYSKGDVLVEFPNNFKVISFAQEVDSQPAANECGTFERLRQRGNCQPQPLAGLPTPTPTPT